MNNAQINEVQFSHMIIINKICNDSSNHIQNLLTLRATAIVHISRIIRHLPAWCKMSCPGVWGWRFLLAALVRRSAVLVATHNVFKWTHYIHIYISIFVPYFRVNPVVHIPCYEARTHKSLHPKSFKLNHEKSDLIAQITSTQSSIISIGNSPVMLRL
jgi:hypothetical protein